MDKRKFFAIFWIQTLSPTL